MASGGEAPVYMVRWIVAQQRPYIGVATLGAGANIARGR